MVLSDDKIGIGIIVRNHLGTLLLAKIVAHMWRFRVDYGELLAIIEGYVTGSSLSDRIIIESDSLLAINSLNTIDEDIYELGALFSGFCNSIDISSICFSHVYVRKYPILAKDALVSI